MASYESAILEISHSRNPRNPEIRHDHCLIRSRSVMFKLSIALLAFSVTGLSIERLQDIYRESLLKENARDASQFLTSKVHVASTEQDWETVQFMTDQFKSFGIKTFVKEYYPLLHFPVSTELKLLEPNAYDATLIEKSDSDIPWLAYSPSGDVVSNLVYANYGSREDFKLLEYNGINVTGSIVLVRYGIGFRGLKVRAAQEAGAAAVLIYSDPQEDGYVKGPVYPDGPWRPWSGVQRGSIHYPNFYPGDPLTPGYPAKKNSKRIPAEEADALPKIPALPISYGDAQYFLKALDKKGILASKIGKNWQGGLSFPYYTGPGGLASLKLNMTFQIKPIWNVFGSIPSDQENDTQIILGAHRDAWVYGAVDPVSGSTSLLEVARGLGLLYSLGWRPKRSILFASWDAEEYGVIGSTEWVEEFSKELSKKTVAYLNIDTAVKGRMFTAKASPSLKKLIWDVTKDVYDPKTNQTIYDIWYNNSKSFTEDEPFVSPLGFGSDYVAFLQYAGIASMDLSFSGPYGVYHSEFDNFDWMIKFGDPDFSYHITMSTILGFCILRLSESKILPFTYGPYSNSLFEYMQEFSEALDSSPFKNNVSITPLWDILEEYRTTSQKFDQIVSVSRSIKTLEPLNPNILDAIMIKSESCFLDPLGIPGRPWYKHIVFAPDEWSGYRAKLFPSLHESLASGSIDSINIAITQISSILETAVSCLKV